MKALTRLAIESVPEDAEMCPVCHGYGAILQIAIDELPLLHAIPNRLVRCGICYGNGWRIHPKMATIVHNKTKDD